jgi:hypothetical protein
VVHLIEDTHVFQGNEGETIWCGGHAPVDGDGRFLNVDTRLASDDRVLYCRAAGARHRPQALSDARFDPGAQILLRSEPDNPHDAQAVGIWDVTGALQLGYIPATLCGEVAASIRSGASLGGQVIREFRLGSSRGERIALHVLIAPAGPVTYVFEDDGE